jgi:hypothetical protein
MDTVIDRYVRMAFTALSRMKHFRFAHRVVNLAVTNMTRLMEW